MVFNHAGWFVMECIRITSHWFAGWPKAYFYVPAPSLFTCVVYYGLLLAGVTGWLFRPAMRRGKFATVTLALVIWSWTCWRESSTTRLTVLPVGGGLAVFCDARGWSDDLLIDCGPTNAVQSLTKPFLRAQGVNRLAHLLLTHGDLHHVGGAEMLADLFPVKHVGASPVRFRSTAYRQTLEHFTQTPDLVQRLSRNERVGDWTILHPTPEDRFPQADDNALVLAASFDGTRVLLLSDLGRPGQAALLERTPDLRADIVVTGLPTASEAISDNFLDAIQPRVIIVGDSDFPVSERASARLCERLAQRSVPVIYTRSAGAVTLEFRGHEWEIRTMEGFRIRSRDAAQRTGAPLPPRDSSGRSGDSNQSSYGVTTTLAASPKPSN